MIAVVGKTRAHSAFHNSTFILAITAPSMRPDASHQPSASPVYRFVSAGVHRCSGRSDCRERRQPPPLAFDIGVLRVPGAAPHRAQAHTASLWASTATAQSSPHPRQTYLFTCSSDECGVMPGIDGGGLLLHRREAFRLSSLRLVFFCLLRIWGI